MKQKRIFQLLLIILAVVLATLPIVLSINSFLTKVVEANNWYSWVQQKIVPVEVEIVGLFVRLFGISCQSSPGGFIVNGIYARLTWNCLGWQSLLFFIVSLIVGLKSGSYTWLSKIELILIGLLGTFWVNIVRIIFTTVLLAVSPRIFAVVFHDYLAALVTIGWLAFFWWFSYSYILEEKLVIQNK